MNQVYVSGEKKAVDIDCVSCVLCRRSVINFLTEVSKFSRMEPKSLSFRLNRCYTQQEDLIFVAERMPNIEKFVLLDWYYKPNKGPRFPFSLWKNLKTLIVVPIYLNQRFEFRNLGENCTNLINFKYLGELKDSISEEIVRYLPSIKRLSFEGFIITITGVTLLITGLKDLKILNLTHCTAVLLRQNPTAKFRDQFVQAASQKLEKIITYSQDCRICNLEYRSKDWRNDEINEFEFLDCG